MFKKILYVIGISSAVIVNVFLVNRCATECPKDEEFSTLFIKSLSMVKSFYETENSQIEEDKLNNNIFFIEKITGRKSKRVAGHYGVIYHQPNDYKEDIQAWQDWYETNNCRFTMKEANQIFEKLPKSINKKHENWASYMELEERKKKR